MANKKVGKKCKSCRKQYQVGYSGMANGVCDSCAGIRRDANGYPWLPGETSQTLVSVSTGERKTISREDAFRGAL